MEQEIQVRAARALSAALRELKDLPAEAQRAALGYIITQLVITQLGFAGFNEVKRITRKDQGET